MTDPVARKCLADGINEKNLIRAVKEFCLKNNLFLVVKPRMKFPVTGEAQRLADLMVWDQEEDYDPPALKELLSVARMSISFQSFGCFDSVFSNVYHLNALLPDEMFQSEEHRYWFPSETPSIWNFPGVCEGWPIEEVIKNLSETPIERFRFHAGSRADYVRRFAGFDDFNSSKRIIDQLELVKSGPVRT